MSVNIDDEINRYETWALNQTNDVETINKFDYFFYIRIGSDGGPEPFTFVLTKHRRRRGGFDIIHDVCMRIMNENNDDEDYVLWGYSKHFTYCHYEMWISFYDDEIDNILRIIFFLSKVGYSFNENLNEVFIMEIIAMFS
jgi:hypothetical protein